ncbi:ABC-2 family transporter protein [Aquisphaera giovannonii]|uniref:ABC-2 family transporter protein n=1 Tax=Aquisphaera giovannonii TaxID=406548 RepID=A0A5B9WA69_9BACT|nr:ABC transporter permease subunit [Aquisphaera giovannonii]QEH36981.1 ABC-2 family transporter protein [Aquisphaera giovannonii]
MRPFLGLLRKNLHDVRGTFLLSSMALFGLGWLFVFVTSLNEARIMKPLADDDTGTRFRMMRAMGVDEESASAAIMMTFWSHPFILLVVSIWAISRGSAAASAEIERGTLDLILSRPVSRPAYLLSHVLVGMGGLLGLAMMLVAGAACALGFNYLRVPPRPAAFLGPGLNLAALGAPIYGYTLLASACDSVRWRPTMIGSVLTLGGFIALVISLLPVFQDYPWRVYLERASIFKLYNPVDAVGAAEHLARDVGLLLLIGAGCTGLALAAFIRRDLPANG